MIDFIIKVKGKFLTQYGFPESVITPGCPQYVPDGKYPMTIDDEDFVIEIISDMIHVHPVAPKTIPAPPSFSVIDERRVEILEELLSSLPVCDKCPRIATYVDRDGSAHYCDKHKWRDNSLPYRDAIHDLEALEARNAATKNS